ncbi:MAG: hypothetical protein IT219_04440 [Bacteroidales bacterium]|nr:hypothetical protein [Bacteroidales bacterium]
MLGFSRKPDPKQHFELNLPSVEKDQHSEIANPHALDDQADEIIIPPAKPPILNAKNIALISVILLILFAGLGIWSWNRLGSLQKIRQAETQQHEFVLDSLLQVKSSLESRLDQLEADFSDLRVGNDSLAQDLVEVIDMVAEKETIIQENVREENALRKQVQHLQTLNDRYETIIAVLNQKNAVLTAENERLRGTTDSLSMQVSELGKRLESQIRQTQSAQYKATSFRVELERRNDKLSVKARKIRELKISFDLNNVPLPYRGNQQLFLVITDDRGLPVDSKNPIQETIKTEKGNVPIVAQATQFQNIIDNQRIVLNYGLEERLKKGTYVVSVYSDKGLLGVASFRLI